jgi:hypothetical protein
MLGHRDNVLAVNARELGNIQRIEIDYLGSLNISSRAEFAKLPSVR